MTFYTSVKIYMMVSQRIKKNLGKEFNITPSQSIYPFKVDIYSFHNNILNGIVLLTSKLNL